MSTGYTHKLVDHGESFRDFMVRLSDAFVGRDRCGYPGDALTPIEPDTSYDAESLKEAQAELAKWQNMSLSELSTELACEHEKALQGYRLYLEERAVKIKRVEDMLAKAKAWEVSDNLSALKKFAVEHLTDELKHQSYLMPAPQLHSAEETLALRLEWAARDIEYHTERLTKKSSGYARLNEWLKEVDEATRNEPQI